MHSWKDTKVSVNCLFGGYMHNLLHSADVLWFVSLRSTNSEALERLQGSAKAITNATSNRKPSYTALNVMKRISAENQDKKMR